MLELGMQETVNQRINFLIAHFEKGNKSAFGRRVDMKSGVVGDLVGGRLNKPSYDAIVKILNAYPAISADWLVLGRGMMLRGEQLVEDLKTNSSDDFDDLMNEEASRNLIRYAMDKAGGFDSFMNAFFESMRPGLSEKIRNHYTSVAEFQNKNSVYRLGDKGVPDMPYNGLLTKRLGITPDEAISLIKRHRIRYASIDDTEQINSLLVSERAVRDFLNEADTQ